MRSYGKTLFWKWRTSADLHLENFEFWRSDCHLYRNSLYASNFIKIGQFSLRYGALTISTWRPQFLSCDLCRHASSYKIPLKRVDKLWPKKSEFQHGGCPPPWIKKNFFWLFDCHRFHYLLLWYTTFHQKSDDFCRAMLCKRCLCRYVVSVRLSRSYILLKRINMSSNFFRHQVVKPF